MRKQELVHLHALYTLVREHVTAREDPAPGAFESSADIDVSPAAIYRSKRAHRRAVLQLAADVATVVADEPTPAPAESTPDGTAVGDADTGL
jgi:hypothetical protein